MIGIILTVVMYVGLMVLTVVTVLFPRWVVAVFACLFGDKEILHLNGNPCEKEEPYSPNRLWHQDLKWYD